MGTQVSDGQNGKSKDGGSEKRKDEERKSVPYYSLFRFSSWLDKTYVIVGCLCAIACGVTSPLAMVQFGESTGAFATYAATVNRNNLTEAEMQKAGDDLMDSVKEFAIEISIVGVAAMLLTYVANTLLSHSASRQAYNIRRLFFAIMLNQDIGWYDVNQTADFASSVTENLSKIEEGMGEKVAIFLFFETVFVAGIIFSLTLGWELALICYISLPVTSITMGIITWLTTKFAEKEMDAYAAASSVAEEALSSIRTVIAFEGQTVESERYSKHLIHAMRNNIRRSLFSSINNAIIWFCMYGSYALAFWYGVELIIREEDLTEADRVYTPGNVVAVFFCSIMSTWSFGLGAPYLEAFSAARGAAVKIFSVIESRPVINESKGAGKRLKKLEGSIAFRNVHFEYPSRAGVKVLDGLNLTVKSGETVALVGSSGCGKSTTIQLIQRFYDPQSGEIHLDGHNIKDFDLNWFRSNIGVVSQEPVLFATTIYENITYGNKHATKFDVERAARKANAHDFIANLPQGYNTTIGERGAQLSGGQKQRIAIARALVREPAILLLDEATSALDSTSEAMVQAALDSASSGCTTIIVAHRLSTVKNADRILVFSDGKVVEEGNHRELIAKKGLYYNLVISQETSSDNEQDNKQMVEKVTEESPSLVIPTSDVRNQAETDDYEVDGTKVKAVLEVIKLNKPEWMEIVVGCMASVLTGAALPVYSLVFGDVVGVLSETNNEILRSEASVYCLYFLAIGIVAGTSTFFQFFMFGRAGEKLTKRVRRLMFESMLHQEMGWFDMKENGVGALCTRLSSDASTIQGASGQCVGTLLNSVSTFIISFVLALSLHWKIALVALSFSPLIFLSVYYEQNILTDDSQTKKSLEGSAKVAIEAIGSIRTVVSLGCEDSFYKLYKTQLQVHLSSTMKKAHFRALMMGLARALMFICYAAALYYGAHLIVTTGLFYSVVFKVTECVVVGSWSIGNAVAYSPNFQKGLVAANTAFKLLNRVPKIRNFPNALSNEWRSSAITYKDIHFSYPTRPTSTVLKGLNLSVLEGKTTALVGSSGCGKSTLIQLLERFYDPTLGDVQVDGDSLRYMDLKMVRSQLGIVSQEPNLFNRTIAENIAYGANGRHVTMEEIIDASKKANIYNFVSSLPLGYETKLGERATQLSGGQKQRIAIARALVRNPKVLLLDEATSALDNESEKVVQEALDNAMKGRTCITIAHRLTTIKDADVICVINEGRVLPLTEWQLTQWKYRLDEMLPRSNTESFIDLEYKLT